jgi:hypothetical protein
LLWLALLEPALSQGIPGGYGYEEGSENIVERFSSCLAAAHVYAGAGWPVFPACGKRPYTQNGLKDATCSAATIAQWWQKWPTANVAILTGEISGLVVLDIDLGQGREYDGYTSFVRLQELYGILPSTLLCRSGGGGFHFYYRFPSGKQVRNKTCLAGLGGIDVRAEGGYIIAPPSVHPDTGERYAWWGDFSSLAPLPAGYVVLLTSPPVPAVADVRIESVRWEPATTGEYWLQRAQDRAYLGNRNETGFWLACQLRDAGLPEDEAAMIMRRYAGMVNVPADPYTEEEALRSLSSAYSRPARDPGRHTRL